MNSTSRPSGSIPCGLLAMLAFSACVEFGLVRRELDWMSVNDWDWRTAKHAAGSAGTVAKQEILLFGDSQIKLGVLPPVVERASGFKTLGLAVGGGHAAGSYYLAR